jgi:hypothetical protein
LDPSKFIIWSMVFFVILARLVGGYNHSWGTQ